jgi:hypothetical protein
MEMEKAYYLAIIPSSRAASLAFSLRLSLLLPKPVFQSILED